MAFAKDQNAYELAFAGRFAAELQVRMRRYDEAEAMAAKTLELSEKHQFSEIAATVRCVLGLAQMQLRGAANGIALIRRGIAELLEVGEASHTWSFFLASAQESQGDLADALETLEPTIQKRLYMAYAPEGLRLRGAIRLKLGDDKAAEADFRAAIALAQTMSEGLGTSRVHEPREAAREAGQT